MKLALLLALCSIASCSGGEKRGNSTNGNGKTVYFEYSNPQYFADIDNGNNFRDPCIVKEGDTYYLTGTRYPHFEEWGTIPGTAIYKSTDLKKWTLVCEPVPRPAEDSEVWWKNYFWAPELFIHNGKYYYTVNCSRQGPGHQNQEVALFVADKVEGPYEPLTKDRSLFLGNDAHIFEDTDGKTYMFTSGIWMFEVDLNKGEMVGEPVQCVQTTLDTGMWTSSHATGIEGPYVVLRGGIYYLFFSCWARGYEIGYATAENIHGPWTMAPEPIYGAMNEAACNRNGIKYEPGYYANKFTEAGHNTVFSGPDGRDWIVAHVFADAFTGNYLDNKVGMAFDPIEFSNGKIIVRDGNRQVNGPTQGLRKIAVD